MMKRLETGNDSVSESGGKGAGLLRLQEAGYPVPRFTVIPSSFFESLAKGAGTGLSLNGKLEPWKRAFDGTRLLAVRSSACAEDGTRFSFAGQFKTILQVPLDELEKAVAEVWLSASDNRLHAYRQHAGVRDLRMAVILQEMVPATAAGVAFGADPLTGNRNRNVISAVAGLGDRLVDGTENGDSYVVEGETIISRTIDSDLPVLTDDQVLLVSRQLASLEELFGGPQDIEFAFDGPAFYLLQSRPVTTLPEGETIVWDNSNIIESYPGLTLPLTYSFIEKMYEAVYRQFSLLLGVAPKRVEALTHVYAHMLGLLNGRVYYNLNSWYTSLAQLPGYSLNAAFMEKMMGVKEKLPIAIDTPAKGGVGDYLQVLRAAGCILKNRFTVKKQKRTFIRDFVQVYDEFDKKEYDACSLSAIWKDYSRFESLMLSRWKAPLVNDFFAMIYFGLLQKICAEAVPGDPVLHNRLLGSSHDIITTAPLERLPQLARSISGDEELKAAFTSLSPGEAWTLLQEPRYLKQREAIEAYLEEWGERCITELKLETVTYRQEPSLLIGILQSYVQKGLTTFTPNTGLDRERSEAERALFGALKGKRVKKRWVKHVLAGARYLVSNRENLRYYRTRGFGMVRRMFLSFGNVLHHDGRLEEARDVFYLQLPELEALAQGAEKDLKALVAARKKEYERFARHPLPERVLTTGPVPPLLLEPPAKEMAETGRTIQGLPCSAGIVQARVKKVEVASALDTLDGQIMATYATDPGWVVLFPSASGILTERGSLLSHAAIVSREMGIPCIVGLTGLMERLQDGDELVMDGSTGLVQITKTNERDEQPPN